MICKKCDIDWAAAIPIMEPFEKSAGFYFRYCPYCKKKLVRQ